MSKRGPERDQDRAPKRRSEGKPIIKMLCPFYCAGAIIGQGGETIKNLMSKTDCGVKISSNDERFPTTSERVVSIQGEPESVEECVLFAQDKIRKDQPPPNARSESHAINAKRKESCKLVVANSSAGRIIGKGGQRIKDMKNDYNVKIDITRTDELPRGFDERVVTIEGDDGNVDNCVKEIVKLVCEDNTATMNWHMFYNDFNDDRRDGGFGSGRRDGFSRDGRDSPHDDRRYDERDRPRDDRYDRRDDDRRGGYDRDGYGGSDSRDRDYGRGDRMYQDKGGYGGGDRGSYRDDRDRDGGGFRDDRGDRDRGFRDGGRDSGRDGFRDSGMDRHDDYGGRDSFGRGGDRDSRDMGRSAGGGGGGGGGGDRRYRDEPRAGPRY